METHHQPHPPWLLIEFGSWWACVGWHWGGPWDNLFTQAFYLLVLRHSQETFIFLFSISEGTCDSFPRKEQSRTALLATLPLPQLSQCCSQEEEQRPVWLERQGEKVLAGPPQPGTWLLHWKAKTSFPSPLGSCLARLGWREVVTMIQPLSPYLPGRGRVCGDARPLLSCFHFLPSHWLEESESCGSHSSGKVAGNLSSQSTSSESRCCIKTPLL